VARHGEQFVCRSRDCRRAYTIEEGIPKFLVAESEVLSEAAWRDAGGAS
jgi:uncharacterized protein YbaR (Trm112 family)